MQSSEQKEFRVVKNTYCQAASLGLIMKPPLLLLLQWTFGSREMFCFPVISGYFERLEEHCASSLWLDKADSMQKGRLMVDGGLEWQK
jgi:hypothetical protein